MQSGHRVIPIAALLLSWGAAIAIARAGDATPSVAAGQAAEGARLYAKDCAKCHGKNGEGTKKAPPLSGPSALPLNPPPSAKQRSMQFHTAKDILDFISGNMPANKPGSLRPEQYAAILEHVLKANGIDVSTRTMDAQTAAAIMLHP